MMNALRTASSLLVATAVVLTFAGCTDTDARLKQAQAKIAATLPAPYYEDLVTEAVDVEDNRLVMRIRSPAGDAARTREAAGFDLLKQSEQRAMYELCALPEIAPLLDTDAILVRRFVDPKDAPFFDVELPARACSTPPADAPAQP
ncbi:hypothetical protein [Pseudoxanthomonas sp.]|jgi:hypothetical protein|uniref:hypothetical protein n=1 Tax=Pseudoxanthomonas sp. TaxID=1871049 RepID=UPI002E12CAE4|nr:hypothetical protein [Pseudoxanthomonas sp.]